MTRRPAPPRGPARPAPALPAPRPPADPTTPQTAAPQAAAPEAAAPEAAAPGTVAPAVAPPPLTSLPDAVPAAGDAGWSPAGPDDPRGRDDALGWVTRAVFGAPGVHVTLADDPAATARYAVVAGRFLLPLAHPRVTAASVLAYNALRPPRVRAARALLGLAARAGRLPRGAVLSVTADGPGALLTAHLAGLLGADVLYAGIGLRPPDPHHKPTLQLFDAAGHPRGYAKVGWNDGTRAMVRAEVATLRDLPPPAPGLPAVPPLVLHTTWHGREVAVVAPMPPGVRRIRAPRRPRTAAMLAVARRGGPAAAPRPLAGSPLVRAWRRRGAGAPEPHRAAVTAAIDALERRDGAVRVEFGHWHGDWVPWNMARHRGRLTVWDWENAGADVPVGFDLAHQAFQTALSTDRQPAAACAAAVDAALDRHGGALGLDPPARRLVADGYLIELWLRTWGLSGAGWNPRLHPALLHVLAGRLGG